jgi:hypothetical protein
VRSAAIGNSKVTLPGAQRRFCASEGGIGAAFLDFKSEQQFLEKIFSFMIPSDTAERCAGTERRSCKNPRVAGQHDQAVDGGDTRLQSSQMKV